MESAIRTVCEPIANKPLKEISFGHLLINLFETAQRFDAQMQPQMLLIQKTLLQIEVVGRQLYPDLDLWDTAQPLLKQWMRERYSLSATLKEAREQLPMFIDSMRKLPHLMQTVVQRASDHRLTIPVENTDAALLRAQMREDARRRDRVLISAVGLLGGIIWIAVNRDPLWPGIALIAASAMSYWYARK